MIPSKRPPRLTSYDFSKPMPYNLHQFLTTWIGPAYPNQAWKDLERLLFQAH